MMSKEARQNLVGALKLYICSCSDSLKIENTLVGHGLAAFNMYLLNHVS